MSESSPSASAFSAAGPALGYLAQVDYTLLAALERMDDEDDFAVRIETLDDIVFHDAESDDATAKWQSKHTIDQTRSLSDASTDLWKTLANWIAEPGEAHTRLVLLAVASGGPTAALLRVGGDRDVVGAQQRLERTAHTSASDSNAGYYAAFLALSTDQRRALLDRIEVFDGVLPIAEVQSLLERAVRKSVKPQRRAALVDRLRGWWHKRAIAHLDVVARGLPDRIGAGELESELLEIADACATTTCRSTCSTWPNRPSRRSPRAIGSSSLSSVWSPWAARGCANASTTTTGPSLSAPVGSATGSLKSVSSVGATGTSRRRGSATSCRSARMTMRA